MSAEPSSPRRMTDTTRNIFIESIQATTITSTMMDFQFEAAPSSTPPAHRRQQPRAMQFRQVGNGHRDKISQVQIYPALQHFEFVV